MSVRGPLRIERGTTLAELAVTLGLFAMVMFGVVATWAKAQEAYFVGSETAEVQQNVRAAVDFMLRELRSTGRDVTVCAFDYSNPAASSGDCDSSNPFDKITSCQNKLCPSGVCSPPAAPAWNTSNSPLGTGVGCRGLYAIPYLSGQYPTTTRVRIRSDRNDNGRIAGAGNSYGDKGEEDVTYALASGGSCPAGVTQCITRDDGSGPVAMVAVDINGFTLTYYPRPGFGPCADTGSGIPNPCPAYGSITTQQQADNIARVTISITAQQTTAGSTINRTLVTDVVLKNRS